MNGLQSAWGLFFSLPWLDDMAHYLHSLPLHPFFSSVHFILTAFALRHEPGSIQFALRHPVASCVMTYIVASSGGILANLMVGGPPLECVVNGWSVLVAVFSWYFIFFSPLDVCFFVCAATPVQLTLFFVEEIGRAKKILSGVTAASALYPHSILAMAIIGMIKGSGKKWGITWYRLVYQPQSASAMELKGLSFITKMAAFLALLFAVNVQAEFCEEQQLLVVAALSLVVICFRSLLMAETDFFNPVLQVLWGLATALTLHPDHPPTTDDSTKTERHKHSPHEQDGKNRSAAQTPDHEKSE